MKRCASPICAARAARAGQARRAALYTGFLFRCGCLRCTSNKVLDAPIVDAAAGALARGAVDDRLGRALAVLANDCRLGAPGPAPLLRADLRLLAARLAKRLRLTGGGGRAPPRARRARDLRLSLDDEDPRVAAAAAFVVRLDQ